MSEEARETARETAREREVPSEAAEDGLEIRRLPVVTTSDLSRSPRKVLERVARGERLIVCWHKRPVATLQPLDGVVSQPLRGGGHDIYGWPIGETLEETRKLNEAQRALLTQGVVRGRFLPFRLERWFRISDLFDSLEEMQLKGLATRTHRGLVLTGRGMVMREALLAAHPEAADDKAINEAGAWD